MLANRRAVLERERFFRKFGYDLPRGIAFALAQALPLGGSVLEIGTGKGRFLMELAKRVATVTTVDITAKERMFARLNARFAGVEDRIKFVLRDAGRLPWRDGAFDAAVTFNAMHHIPHFQRVLKEMLRVVKPGGKIVLGDFSPRGFQIMDRIHRAESKTHQHEVHHFCDLQRFLRERGLKTRLRKGCNQEVLVATLPSANVCTASETSHS
ncbi:MAG: class I SAM-dependent methyltransferase [Verrucomicrobia bacterium]|nr:class I SAM-dependent methyltransferase [Verrucomicrobiota bacterium]